MSVCEQVQCVIFVCSCSNCGWDQVVLVREYTNSAHTHTAIESSPVQEEIDAD